jgi:mRNA interferase YafQ
VRIVFTSQFKKDFKKAEKQNKDLAKLESVITSLFSEGDLDPALRDHPLVSNWKGYRECHLTSDWLLIYKLNPDELILVRLGSHSDLFE